MQHVEELLRSALAAAGEASIDLDYGLRITHASKAAFQYDHFTVAPLETPIRITMKDLLCLFAERLKEDAARRRGSVDDTGLHMSRAGEGGLHLTFTAYSPQDRHLGKADELSKTLLADVITATSRARPAGEFRANFAEWNRQQVSRLRCALPEWGYSDLADLITASNHDWNHAPTALGSTYRYRFEDLSSSDRVVATGARRRRTALMDWLREQTKTRASSTSRRSNPRRKREERSRSGA